LNETANCRTCGEELTDENWYPSSKLRNNRVCKTCLGKQKADRNNKWRRVVCTESFKKPITNTPPFKCGVCDSELNDDTWRPSDKHANHLICKECANRYVRHRYASIPHVHIKRKRARQPMSVNKKCALFLGVHIAEQVLANVFEHVERMPIHNPGYDFVCSKGKKIDVKSSCVNKDGRWRFKINQNRVPDFFLALAFDNRKKLNPKHMWLIPRDEICHKRAVSIAPSTAGKWDEYKLDIEKVITCCNEMRL